MLLYNPSWKCETLLDSPEHKKLLENKWKFSNLPWTQNMIKHKINVKIKFYLIRYLIILLKLKYIVF